MLTIGPGTASAVRFSQIGNSNGTSAQEDPQPISKSDRMEWGRLMRESREQLRRNRFREAETALLAALAIGNHHGPPDQRVRTTLFYLGKVANAYFEAGRFADHTRLAPEIILAAGSLRDDNESFVRSHRRALAQSFEQTGQLESARSIVDSLIENSSSEQSGRSSLLLQRASLSLGLNDLAAAEGDIDTALLELDASEWIDPEPRLAAQRLKAQLLLLQGRPAEAETAFTDALAQAAVHAPASLSAALLKNDLASLYLERDRAREALPLARASVAQLEEQRADLYRQVASLQVLAAVLVALGRDDEAESAFERAVNRSSDLPEASASLRARYVAWLRDRGKDEDAMKFEAVTESTPPAAQEPRSLSLPAE